MNLLYGTSGEVIGAEMTPAEYARRSSSSKTVINGVPHVTVWCVVGQRSEVPVRFSAAFARAAVIAASLQTDDDFAIAA